MMQTDMIIKKYTFGGVCFEIRSELPLLTVPKYEEFLSDDTAKSDYIFEIIPDRTNSTSLSGTVREGNRFRFTVSEKYISGLGVGHVLSSANAAYVFPDHDGFILHASYILYRGEAILFSAPSGTGKSTQAAFWKEHRGAEIINGDRVLVIKRDGVFYACGVYVSGTSGICGTVSKACPAAASAASASCFCLSRSLLSTLLSSVRSSRGLILAGTSTNAFFSLSTASCSFSRVFGS